MAPKYNYTKEESIRFVNPYNFVSIDPNSNNKRLREESSGELLCGVLKCKLVTKTPLAIPDTENKHPDDNIEGHYHYPFYKIGDKHMIPGSSIRGVIRSMYETLSDSCFVTMPDDEYLSKRVEPGRAFDAGLLIRETIDGNDTWVLYEAERLLLPYRNNKKKKYNTIFTKKTDDNNESYIINGEESYYYGDYVDLNDKKDIYSVGQRKVVKSFSKAYNCSEYVVYVGENIYSKNADSIFRKGEKIDDISNIEDAFERLCETVCMYQDEAINREFGKNHKGYKGFERAKRNGCIPLWYKKTNDKNGKSCIVFSIAAIGRIMYNNTVNKLVGKWHVPCTERNNLCPACELFGMVKDEGKGSLIRITDAVLKNDKKPAECTLKELGSPKTSYLPFYSEGGKNYDEKGAKIKGRKFYWHIAKAKDSNESYKTNDKTKRNSTVELMPVGAEFEFDVYYDGITERQYKELVWTLTLGNTDEERYYKIGHGKPLGLGSVDISILSDKRRGFNDGNYEVKEIKGKDIEKELPIPETFYEETVKQVCKIADFHIMDGQDVRYPYVSPDGPRKEYGKNDLASHQWFTSNKGRRKDAPKPQLIKAITGSNHSMAIYKVKKVEEGNNGHNNNNNNNNNNKSGSGKKK